MSLRVSSVMNDVVIRVMQGERNILSKRMRRANPAEMIMLDIEGNLVAEHGDLEVFAE